VLAHPDPSRQFILNSDASGFAVAAVLSQQQEDGSIRPVACCMPAHFGLLFTQGPAGATMRLRGTVFSCPTLLGGMPLAPMLGVWHAMTRKVDKHGTPQCWHRVKCKDGIRLPEGMSTPCNRARTGVVSGDDRGSTLRLRPQIERRAHCSESGDRALLLCHSLPRPTHYCNSVSTVLSATYMVTHTHNAG
jgi:hypothetical protein